MNIRNYDVWKLSCGLEDEKVVCLCDYCEREIYGGEEYYIVNGQDNVHEDCLVTHLEESDYIQKTVVV